MLYPTAERDIIIDRNLNFGFGEWVTTYTSVNKPTPSEIGAAPSEHTHDTKYLRRYDINRINIDNTSGCWTVDISKEGYGTYPATSINVTQFTSGHFFIQMAVTCQNSTDTTRNAGAVWVRNKYALSDTSAWSAWSKLAFV
jgi:hypothetical protein